MLRTPALSDKAFRRLYTVSRRNAMERNRRRLRLCPPGKAPIQATAGDNHGVRGPALAAWKIWLAPGRLCLLCLSGKWVIRPQTDEILSSWKPSAVVCRRDWACGWDFISCPMPQRVSLSSTTCLTAGGPPPSAEGGKIKSRAKNRKDQNTSIPFSQEQGISDACVLAHVHSI